MTKLRISKDLALPLDAVKALAPRLWAKVEKGPGCWLWTGYQKNGYGVLYVGEVGVYVHRLAFFLQAGAWPELQVCHRCDVRRCCRGDHLFEGSQAENLADMRAKGRAKKPPRLAGMANSNAHLTDEQVKALRALRAAGVHQREVARRFGVSQSTVWRLFHQKVRAA